MNRCPCGKPGCSFLKDLVLDRLWKALNEPGGELVKPSEDEGEDEQGKHSGHQEDESPH